MATLESCQYYCYVPSFMAAAGAMGMFAQFVLIHGYQSGRAKSKCMIPLIIGGLFEFLGYGARLIGHFESPNFKLIFFAAQAVALTSAPALMAASVFLHHERIIKATDGAQLSPWKLKTFKLVFLIGDCFSFLIQSVGSALRLTSDPQWIRLGNRLVMMGLGEQIIFLVIFGYVAGTLHYRLARNPPARLTHKANPRLADVPIPFKKHLMVLYLAAILIIIRSAIRLLENMQGSAGLIHRHEYFLYLFDAAFMVMVMAMFHFVHPSQMEALDAFYAHRAGDVQYLTLQNQSPQLYFEGFKIWEGKRLPAADDSIAC
ncbi:hypothetical protein BP6252_12053 [Coleophoma cylindrospora]|uniref:Uncharacterized protein n=1 Tax=Coleophoma cylindrospora TaxID=1849047 RepID=A0A3D8QG70_9HELO|nr:hypothetical protein BP6252_12053 [Coleophoma cylindrospora]